MPEPDPIVSPQPWKRNVSAGSPSVIRMLRRGVVDHARFLGASDETCDAIALAVSEAVTNVVRHAYVGQDPGSILVDAELERSNQLLVRIADEGRGPTPRADSPGLGLGLGVMAQTADEFSISNRHDTRGTVVTLRFLLRGRDPNDAQAADQGTGEPTMQI